VSDVTSSTHPTRNLRPNRISIWPVEPHGFGIDFTYHGATGYSDAEHAEHTDHGLNTRFIQKLDGAWTVRIGPLQREHMRTVLDHFAW